MNGFCSLRIAPRFVLLSLVALPVIGQVAARPWERMRAEQVAAARREGIPTSILDLQNRQVADKENAAVVFDRIREMDKRSRVSQKDGLAIAALSSDVLPTKAEVQSGRTALEKSGERFLLIQQAAACPSFYRPPKVEMLEGGMMLDTFSGNAAFRDHTRWLLADSLVKLEDGRPLEAIESAALAFGLARQVISTGSIISYLTGAGIDSMALGGLRRILYRAGNDADVAQAVKEAIDKQRRGLALSTAMRGEVAVALIMNQAIRRQLPELVKKDAKEAFGNLSYEDLPAYRTWTRKFNYPLDPVLAGERYMDMNDAHYLKWMRMVIPMVDQPYPKAIGWLKRFAREAEKAGRHPDYALASLSISTVSWMPAVKARTDAQAAALGAGAAVLSFNAAEGRYPDTLAEAMDSIPQDPFDLRPLRYRREGKGFVVYSVGESGRFNGGQPDHKPDSKEVLFRYPFPSYARK